MTTADLQERFGVRVEKKWVVLLTEDGTWWRQSDDTWVNYEQERERAVRAE